MSIIKYRINISTIDKPTKIQTELIKKYFLQIPVKEILIGLKFAHNRWLANDAGTLKVGRKSIIRKETHSLTIKQAKWRLKNWDLLLKNYKKMGYSNSTIYRIKKALNLICK
ncbi:MAG: hypothetical protein KAF24_00390 [Nitrosopumilaceae archaeon]|nr:hypothetical protein [Nitrosopumilaceae archaeon]